MFLLMFLGLYTSRIALKILGAEDFGIYNVVGGVVVLFLFLNNALTAAVQRYLNFYLGKDDIESVKKVFSQSFYVFLGLCLVIAVFSETIGLLIVEKYLIIPNERITVARIIYQLSIASTIFLTLRIPFNAVIIAYENMSFYAYTSLVEGILKLVTTIILVYIQIDKLLLLAAFNTILSAFWVIVFLIYCKSKFSVINFKRYTDKALLRGIIEFSGWNIIGSAVLILSNQGVNVIINRFFGVAVNAAMGVANQVNTAIYAFLTNFQIAFNPQIVKSYAQKDYEYLNNLVINTSKYSFFLLYFIILPFSINVDFVLQVWLVEVPRFSNAFILHLCFFTLIDSLSGPLWMLAEAEGNIKKYQIVSSVMGLTVLPLTYISFKLGLPVYMGLLFRNILTFIFMLWRLTYLRERTAFPIEQYVKKVFFKLAIIVPISLLSVYVIHRLIPDTVLAFFISCTASCIILVVLYYFIGISSAERKLVYAFIREKMKR
jgi:putative transmembrane protein